MTTASANGKKSFSTRRTYGCARSVSPRSWDKDIHMRGLPGWGMLALLVAFIALCYLPSEHKQNGIAPDQVTMGAPATMPAFARTIHIQKDALPTAQPDVPLWAYTREAPSLRKGNIACMTCLPVSLPVQVAYRAIPVSHRQRDVQGHHRPPRATEPCAPLLERHGP